MIAAAAAPIWRELPEAPRLPPEPSVLHAALTAEAKPSVKPSAYQPAIVKAAPATATEVVPAQLAAVDTMHPDADAPTTEAATTTNDDPTPSVVDPVSGRYGL